MGALAIAIFIADVIGKPSWPSSVRKTSGRVSFDGQLEADRVGQTSGRSERVCGQTA